MFSSLELLLQHDPSAGPVRRDIAHEIQTVSAEEYRRVVHAHNWGGPLGVAAVAKVFALRPPTAPDVSAWYDLWLSSVTYHQNARGEDELPFTPAWLWLAFSHAPEATPTTIRLMRDWWWSAHQAHQWAPPPSTPSDNPLISGTLSLSVYRNVIERLKGAPIPPESLEQWVDLAARIASGGDGETLQHIPWSTLWAVSDHARVTLAEAVLESLASASSHFTPLGIAPALNAQDPQALDKVLREAASWPLLATDKIMGGADDHPLAVALCAPAPWCAAVSADTVSHMMMWCRQTSTTPSEDWSRRAAVVESQILQQSLSDSPVRIRPPSAKM